MKKVYYKIYYTIYRVLIWLGQSDETDMIRTNVFVLITLFTMLIVIGSVTFLIGITGKIFIVNSKIQGIILALFISAANAYIIFYKSRYKEIESTLSLTWSKNKSKNILLTLTFVLCSIAVIFFSIIYIKEHPVVGSN
jgi:hypothetical protein